MNLAHTIAAARKLADTCNDRVYIMTRTRDMSNTIGRSQAAYHDSHEGFRYRAIAFPFGTIARLPLFNDRYHRAMMNP